MFSNRVITIFANITYLVKLIIGLKAQKNIKDIKIESIKIKGIKKTKPDSMA